MGPVPIAQPRFVTSCSAELFPLDVRSFMSGVSNCASSLFIFTVVKTYPALADALTMAGAFWYA